MAALNAASGAVAVTPNDGANLGFDAYGLYIGTAGTLKVDTVNGTPDKPQTVTFANVVAGLLPLRVRKVYATGTSATQIVAFEE